MSGNYVLNGMSGNFAVYHGIFAVRCRLHGCLFTGVTGCIVFCDSAVLDLHG